MPHEYTTKLRFISDNAHGWLEVPTVDVEASGFIPSPWSYIDKTKGMTYLEEDLDVIGYFKAGKLYDATIETRDYPGLEVVDIRLGAGHCWIRDLPHCPDNPAYVSPLA